MMVWRSIAAGRRIGHASLVTAVDRINYNTVRRLS